MRVRDQLVVGAALGVAVWFSLLRIAESKNEAAVGAGVHLIGASHPDEMAALARLVASLERIGQSDLARKVEALRADGRLWVAPSLGPDRWAVFVESLHLVRRIYVRRLALVDPVRHLYPVPRRDVPPAYQEAFAQVALGGALVHEIAHYEGALEERAAYAREIAWYEEVRGGPFLAGLDEPSRKAWEWAIDAALQSARGAALRAGAA